MEWTFCGEGTAEHIGMRVGKKVKSTRESSDFQARKTEPLFR